MNRRRCTIPPEGTAAEIAARHRAPVPVLETERLRMRAPETRDMALWSDLLIEGFAYTRRQAWIEFSYYTAAWMLQGHGLWTVERRDTGETVGFVHLALEWEDDEPELGWIFRPETDALGFATEAARAAQAFGAEHLPSFVSFVAPDNVASTSVLSALGAEKVVADPDDPRVSDEMSPQDDPQPGAPALRTVADARMHVWRHGGLQ